jgi:hypothetical protein
MSFECTASTFVEVVPRAPLYAARGFIHLSSNSFQALACANCRSSYLIYTDLNLGRGGWSMLLPVMLTKIRYIDCLGPPIRKAAFSAQKPHILFWKRVVDFVFGKNMQKNGMHWKLIFSSNCAMQVMERNIRLMTNAT